MEKIIYACQWGRNKESTWSGTTYSLYKALEVVVDLEEFEIKDIWYEKYYRGVLRKLGIDVKNQMAEGTYRKNNRRFLKQYKNQPVKVIQFSECPKGNKNLSYLYLDLSIRYIKELKENDKKLFAYSEFENIPQRVLNARYRNQEEAFKRCQGIFTMGEWLVDYMVNKCGIPKEKVHSVGAGCNLPFRPVDFSKRNGNKILFVGKNFERKGGKIVVDAFGYLRKHFMKNAELYIIGPEKNPLKESLEGIKYVGQLSGNELVQYYEMCDIFCMPSYFEAYGIVFIEALCYGLPCIGRNCFEMPYMIHEGENGCLIDGDDPVVLAEKMHFLLLNEDIKSRTIKDMEKIRKMHSWNNIARKMTDIILKGVSE